MKKNFFMIICTLSIGLIFLAGCSIVSRTEKNKTSISINNVFEEIYEAQMDEKNELKLPSLVKVLNSTNVRKTDAVTIFYPSQALKENEKISIYLGFQKNILIDYRLKLADNTYLFITYKYQKHILSQNVSITFTEISDDYVEERISSSKEQTNKEEIYRFYGATPPSQESITSPDKVLEYLKPYNIDKTWLEKKSHEILYDDVLKVWFEKGSKRYSFKNLGNLKIEQAEMFK